MSDIFVSYANGDRSRAATLVGILEQRGWSVWWDRTILPGKTWDQVIEEALDNARCVIVLWSQNSIRSDWVRTEAEEAHRRGILVPVLLDPVSIPLAFRRIQAANLADWSGTLPSAAFDELARAISEILSKGASKALPAVAPSGGIIPPIAVTPAKPGPEDTPAAQKLKEDHIAPEAEAPFQAAARRDVSQAERHPSREPAEQPATARESSRRKPDNTVEAQESIKPNGSRRNLVLLTGLALTGIAGLSWYFLPTSGSQRPSKNVRGSAPNPPTSANRAPSAAKTSPSSKTNVGPGPIRQYKLERELGGHSGEVTAVLFSPDARTLISAGRDSQINFWDLSTFRRVRTLRHDDIMGAALSADGTLFAAGGLDAGLRLWGVSSGNLVATLGGGWHIPQSTSDDSVYAIAFSPDGHVMAWGDTTQGPSNKPGLVYRVRVWDISSKQETHVLGPSGDPEALGMAFSYDGRLLAAAGSIGITAFSPDGRWLASGGMDKSRVRLWRIPGMNAFRWQPAVG